MGGYIKGFDHSKHDLNGLDDEGLLLVYEMQKQGFLVDSVTVTALLSAASNLRNREIGKQTHAYLLRHGIQFQGMESYIIDMYAKSGLIRNSQLLFEKSNSCNRDQATWNAMIAGLAQNGLVEEAIIVFKQMLQQNVMPNAVTLASVLPACSLMGNVDLGKQLHGFSVRNLLDQNVFVGTALVDMYSKSGAIKLAESMFFDIPEKNAVTHTTMILGYGQHGMGERALSLFRSMQASNIQPDAITFVAVLSACAYAGLVDEGLHIFRSMEREFKIHPSTEHYCCVTDMLGKVGRVVEAYEFVEQLGEEGEGNWDNVGRVRREMKEKGCQSQVAESLDMKREKLPIKRCVEMVMPIQESEYKSFGGESNAQERRLEKSDTCNCGGFSKPQEWMDNVQSEVQTTQQRNDITL
ncbi:hypothetical protein SCA6_013932 [Theobroma cacao]